VSGQCDSRYYALVMDGDKMPPFQARLAPRRARAGAQRRRVLEERLALPVQSAADLRQESAGELRGTCRIILGSK
jgi:hypothetical protein